METRKSYENVSVKRRFTFKSRHPVRGKRASQREQRWHRSEQLSEHESRQGASHDRNGALFLGGRHPARHVSPPARLPHQLPERAAAQRLHQRLRRARLHLAAQVLVRRQVDTICWNIKSSQGM